MYKQKKNFEYHQTYNSKIKHKRRKQPTAKHSSLKRYKRRKENYRTNNNNKHNHTEWDIESVKFI